MKTNKQNQSTATLTEKDRKRGYFRWWFQSQICFNYETMQSAGFVAGIGKIVEKLYGDDKELVKEKLNDYYQFYNTNPWMGNLIFGTVVAMEETKQKDVTKTTTALKTGLMGPLAGIGDSIFFVIPMAILGAIAAYMAVEGSALGILIALAGMAVAVWIRYKMFSIGYKVGVSFLTSRKELFDRLSESASILGLTVIGGLVSSIVKVDVPLVISYGEVQSSIQDTLNMIMPKLLPFLFTLFGYWILGKKKMTTVKFVFLIIGISILGSVLGILG